MEKIIILANKYPNKYEENVNVFTQQVTWSLVDAGAECVVICPMPINYSKNNIKFNRTREEKTEYGKIIKIHHPKYIGFGQTGKYLLKTRVKLTQFFYNQAVNKVLKKIDKKNATLFAEFLCPAGVAASVLGNKYNLKSIMQCGEATYQGDIKYGNQYLRKKLKYLSGVIALSKQNKDFLLNAKVIESGKVTILPSGYRKERIYKRDKIESRKKLGLPVDKFIVGFCGSFDNRKGILRLEKAIDGIDVPDVVLAAVGKGALMPTSPKLVFRDTIPHSELAYFYSSIDVFAFPTYNEGCCTAIVEAIACGCPIISSNRSFNYDICKENNSILIEPNDIDELKRSIIYLKNNKDAREKMSIASLELAKNLSLEAKSRKILEYINEI
ncbi:glycosyltransferase family 4 protein [Clostridium sp. 3-3]|uniref:glycosyltransferase family 4 protein n=1 Tax=Clostridium sp. 3-3 TaxID=2070757 RepID=UPI0015E170FD|nr:glycosyltransferase family 4 protein [Clostridium sp. 3-3]